MTNDSTTCDHDWGGFDRTICMCTPTGTMHTCCTKCGEVDGGCAAND